MKEIYTPEIKKEVVAFANASGGVIYIGITDSGELLGLEKVDDVLLQLTNAIRNGIKPDVTMFTQCELLDVEGKSIIKLHINEGASKPYYLSDKGLKSNGVYI